MTAHNSGPLVGLMIWDEPLRSLVRECLYLVGVSGVTELPTTFPAALSGEFFQPFAEVDLALIEAFNPGKYVRDAEGYRLAKTLCGAASPRFGAMVLFRSMPASLRNHPCFIDFATFDTVDARIERMLGIEPAALARAFAAAGQAWPQLDNIPIHRSHRGENNAS